MSDPDRGPVAAVELDHAVVWRVGYRPDPWPWVGWEWATSGRFHGRWDDIDGNFRTAYVGSSLLACLVELLADFRPDPHVVAALDDIDEDPEDAMLHPTAVAGELAYSWLEPRVAGTGRLSGIFCRVTTLQTIAALHPRFVALALGLGLKDFDAAALKDGRARRLTQSVSTYLYTSTDLDGIEFSSRHGDDLTLWSVFERPLDPAVSPHVSDTELVDLDPDHHDLVSAMEILGLRWAGS